MPADLLHGYGPTIVQGLGVTLGVAAASLAVACVFGLAGAAAALSASRVARGLATAYTTLIRGVPDLLLMLAVFYGGQTLLNRVTDARGWGYVDVPPVAAGVLTLGFIFGAYLAETFRGAVMAVPRGQSEAARAFGMRPAQVWRRIVLPQMVRHALPGFANNWLVMVKATALVSIIGLDDMVHRANLAASATRQPFTFFGLVALMYLAITSVSLLLLMLLERRCSPGVRRVAL